MNPYRQRVWLKFKALLNSLNEIPVDILDFGSGDGWFSVQVQNTYPSSELTSIDVKHRESVFRAPLVYEPGSRLPFDSASFDLVYAVDVLHHCHSPEFYLDELGRVSRRYILIKDHVWRQKWQFWALAILDELGNRRFGIPSPQHYQYSNDWSGFLAARGWRLSRMIHPCRCHVGILGALTNRLQYIALYERVELPLEETKLQSR